MENNRQNLYIGIDVGGTSIKAGITDENGSLITTTKTKTASNQEEILQQLCDVTQYLLKSSQSQDCIKGIGVAVPGDVDVTNGIAMSATNLPWSNLPVTAALQSKFNLPARLENDTDAGVLGELLFGKAKGMKNVVYIAIGTGVGGGLILNGQLYRGKGGAGEIGHSIALSDGPICKCGTRGCLEAIASTIALVAAASKAGGIEFENSAQVFDAAQSGNQAAQAAIALAGKALASVIISVSRLLAPEVVIIGGGVSKAGPKLLEAIEVGYSTFASGWGAVPVVFSDTADWSGVLGAAAAVSMHLAG